MNGQTITPKDTGLKAKVNSPEKASFDTLIKKMRPSIEMALPKHLTPERIMRVAMTAYKKDTRLQQCDMMTILAGVIQAAQLGLEVNTVLGQAYLIPYGKMAQLQIGYQGYLDIAYRTAQYKTIGAYEVYEDDTFSYALGTKQEIIHIPCTKPTGEPTHYYAFYKLLNGGESFVVMSHDQVTDHAKKFSKSYTRDDAIWKKHPIAMAKKTCILKLLKYAPKSIEFSEAVSQDFSAKKDILPNMIDAKDYSDEGDV